MLGKNEWKIIPGIKKDGGDLAFALMRRKWLFWHIFRWSTDRQALERIILHMDQPVVHY